MYNPKYIINDGKISRETTAPKSLKAKYEIMNGVKLEKNFNVIELDDRSFQMVDLKNEKLDEEFIMTYATMCRRCNRNFLLEKENEFTCYYM